MAEAEGAKREMKAAVCQFEDLEADYSNKVYEYDELQRKYNEVLGALQDIGLQHSHLQVSLLKIGCYYFRLCSMYANHDELIAFNQSFFQVDVNQFLTRRWVDDATVTSCRCGKMFSVTVRKVCLFCVCSCSNFCSFSIIAEIAVPYFVTTVRTSQRWLQAPKDRFEFAMLALRSYPLSRYVSVYVLLFVDF
ncbi:hypothetical protein TTRE_0000120501 [Trichuris trichiura]|uniref:Uncharacterized protein n=1 Tax=Trichuris trichiura TaxID=36087 RepID=A0A077YZQ0_TRITR|nr:hypothetical protein TTRE_0000120501 [Trichuris trichiura]